MTGQHRQAAMRHRSTARLLVSNGLIPATLPAVHELVTEPTTIRERGRDHRPLELRVTLLAPAVNFRPSGCGSTCWTFSFSGRGGTCTSIGSRGGWAAGIALMAGVVGRSGGSTSAKRTCPTPPVTV